MAPRLVIFGRQGAGKGTQCAFLTRHYGAVHISTGDMLRAAVAAGTEFGAQARQYMDAGQLLPDEVMVGVVQERLNEPDVTANGFLLDGFPRTVPLAEALCAIVDVDLGINLDVAVDVVPLHVTDYGLWRLMSRLDVAGEVAVREGAMTADEVRRLDESWRALGEAGTFFAVTSMVMVTGVSLIVGLFCLKETRHVDIDSN